MNPMFVACGCSEGYHHGIGTVERKGAVALVKKGGRGLRQFRFFDMLARLSLISNDSTVAVTVRHVSGVMI
jgi:hypothetical protein